MILNPILNSIYFMFDLSFLIPSFSFLLPSFLLYLVFSLNLPVLFYVPLPFPFWIIKVFEFSGNLSDIRAITFCWRRDPGRRIDSFDPNKKKGLTTKRKQVPASNSEAFGKASVAFPNAMAYSNRDGCEVTMFNFRTIGDLIPVAKS